MGVIENFTAATAFLPTAEVYRRWSAIGMLAAACHRNVHTQIIDGLPLYANMFIMLVGPPGSGKSLPIHAVRKCLVQMPHVALSANSMSIERQIQALGEVFPEESMFGNSSYVVLVPEFAAYLRQHKIGGLQFLADIWECQEVWQNELKQAGFDYLYTPYFNMLTGVQPKWFTKPEADGFFGMGLQARTVLVCQDHRSYVKYSGSESDVKAKQQIDEKLDTKKIVEGMKKATKVKGLVPFADDALIELQTWADEDFPPLITDPKLEDFAVRRDMHVAKVALLVALSDHPNKPVISLDDFNTAREWMIEAEGYMPIATQGISGNSVFSAERIAVEKVEELFAKYKKPVQEWKVRDALKRDIEPWMVHRLIDELLARRELISINQELVAPNRLLRPGK